MNTPAILVVMNCYVSRSAKRHKFYAPAADRRPSHPEKSFWSGERFISVPFFTSEGGHECQCFFSAFAAESFSDGVSFRSIVAALSATQAHFSYTGSNARPA